MNNVLNHRRTVLIAIFFLITFLLYSTTVIYANQIKLRWDANSESDLAGYKVHYKVGTSGEPYDGTGATEGNSPIIVPLTALSDISNPVFILTNLSNTVVYYISVTAYCVTTLESGYSNEVDGLIIPLTQGENLISFYRQPTNTNITAVLSSIENKYSKIQTFTNGRWRFFIPAHPELSDLTIIEAGHAYFIHMTESAELLMFGDTVTNTTNLTIGPNMVGFNTPNACSVVDALSSIEGKYSIVQTFTNGVWEMYDPNNPPFSNLDTMHPGCGYYINTTENCEWRVPP